MWLVEGFLGKAELVMPVVDVDARGWELHAARYVRSRLQSNAEGFGERIRRTGEVRLLSGLSSCWAVCRAPQVPL